MALLSLGFLAAALAAFLIVRAGGATPRKRWLVAVTFGAILCGGIFYMAIGKPTMPDQPFAARMAQLRHSDLLSLPAEAIEVMLQDALRRDPNDPRPHAFYGRVLMSEGRYDEALRAFMGALRRDPKFADALAGVGQSLLAINGAPTPEAIAALEAAIDAMPPDEPRRAQIGMMVSALKP
ncbi:MAG: tetratricopeptide repeat protein, partial [Caulobacterales bacterium]